MRDNLKNDFNNLCFKKQAFAIVDEVDSILIDEARTPLIISGPAQDRSELYLTIDKIIPELSEEHYTIDEKSRNVTFTDEGNDFLEILLQQKKILPQSKWRNLNQNKKQEQLL